MLDKMAQQVKSLPHKSGDLRWLLETRCGRRESTPQSCPVTRHSMACVCPSIQRHNNVIN